MMLLSKYLHKLFIYLCEHKHFDSLLLAMKYRECNIYSILNYWEMFEKHFVGNLM